MPAEPELFAFAIHKDNSQHLAHHVVHLSDDTLERIRLIIRFEIQAALAAVVAEHSPRPKSPGLRL